MPKINTLLAWFRKFVKSKINFVWCICCSFLSTHSPWRGVWTNTHILWNMQMKKN